MSLNIIRYIDIKDEIDHSVTKYFLVKLCTDFQFYKFKM